ncbi:hypothetical protein [Pseudomonas sp.]|uniref:hypothetical protein n=1 Tax=Pseudomonas sp. TaxID=306 RepID=UPI003D0CD9CF
MGDPRERAASKPLPVIGDGCTRRYDPDALTAEHGTAFADAAALWARLQGERERAGPALSDGTDDTR